MFAAIDLGSNSFRLQVGEYVEGTIRLAKTAREPNRLAAGLDKNHYLTDAAIKDGVEAVASLRQILDEHPIRMMRAVATHTLRIARNAADFLAEAENTLGYPIEVISGEEEGRLIYLGVDNMLARPDEGRVVIDIGGGSTEIICGKGRKIEYVKSFHVGTVRQGMTFFPDGDITAEGFDAAILSARNHFEDTQSGDSKHHWQEAYGSSGIIRAIAKIIAANDIGDGRVTTENLDELRRKMIAAGNIHRLNLTGVIPERVASLVGGLSILIALAHDPKMPVMQPVTSGLRMGILWDLCLQSTETNRQETAKH